MSPEIEKKFSSFFFSGFPFFFVCFFWVGFRIVESCTTMVFHRGRSPLSDGLDKPGVL